jgi:CheY-like chemotaxis protein
MKKSAHVLIVEDNDGDILLISEALEEARFINKITIKRDGAEAIEYFEKELIPKRTEFPDLILLDINLPKKNGHEVLKYLKSSDSLKQIPVVVFTTSSSQKDMMEAYKEYANCYIIKPTELNDFTRVITEIENFWFDTAQTPC